MITSIFNKSKSINLVIVFLIAFLAFLIGKGKQFNESVDFAFITKQTITLFIIYSTIFLLNFITSKNSLTKKNNYEMLLFSLFLLTITQTVGYFNVINSNFFVLLGLRRIMSLRSPKETKKKLFDAAFWIAIAALFYFWAILFFALIFIALAFYSDNNLRHWIVPFLGAITVLVISIAFSIIFYDDYLVFFKSTPQISYDFSYYNNTKYLVAITLLFSFGIWSSIFYSINIKKKKKAFRASFKIIIFAAIIGFLMVAFSDNKNGSEFLFLFAPLTIIITNYVETIQEKWFKEVFLLVLVMMPFALLLL